ncbi:MULTISPECIES: TRAP transporter large permease subunit [unclassified Paracoccus (in: a-proteobacteria)]|uniref:TRAP transporter large permease subunit n=1 Tax=unclassified Paracoccus (in: a-proteobacteria) TaxID=2688777 RepID=UPI0015FF2E64|nr:MULTISPECIES: TRAP transporter large permease subunit [unclassified Paracoccus (in: a-proteobacteria)]MBB1491422.1 TRAP transporter large permease subunit [Paracoccus sp. MC1854]MBB1497694.1 TRAP transporter large permease subunit [Paracoccus sp. MC1862]QQO44128.1 TRAP transporter large permease subunit [Paracoccus sp. MC1862]
MVVVTGIDVVGRHMFNRAIATGMIFSIIIGAEIFGEFVTVAGVTQGVSALIAGRGPWTAMLCIVVIYLLLGCVPEYLSIMLLRVPVSFPVVAGMDCGTEALGSQEATLIWFAVVVVVTMEIGLIIPRGPG